MSVQGPTLEQVLAAQAKNPNSPDHDLGVTYVIATHILRIFSVVPAVLFLRRRFGERYLKTFHVVASWWLVVFAALGTWFSDWRPPWQDDAVESGAPTVGFLFLALYSLQLARHYFGVLRRRLTDDFSVHSRSNGLPWRVWPLLRLPESVVGMVVEPLLILILGYILGALLEASLLQGLTWFVAIAYFVEQQLLADAARAQLLDQADALLERDMAAERARIIKGAQAPAASGATAAFASPAGGNLRAFFGAPKQAASPPSTSNEDDKHKAAR